MQFKHYLLVFYFLVKNGNCFPIINVTENSALTNADNIEYEFFGIEINNTYFDETNFTNISTENLSYTEILDIFDENNESISNFTDNSINEEQNYNNKTDKIILALLICCGAPILFCVCLILAGLKEMMQDLIITIKNKCILLKQRKKIKKPKVILKEKINKLKVGEKDKTKITCAICMEENNKNILELNCNHRFHVNCIKTWIEREIEENRNPSCPFCRSNIFDENEISKIKCGYVENSNYVDYSSDSSYNTDY